MNRLFVRVVVVMVLCAAASLVHAAQRGRGGAKPGGVRGNEQPEGRGRENQERNTGAARGREDGRGNQSPGGDRQSPGGNRQSPGGEWSQRSHGGASNRPNGGERPNEAGEANRNDSERLPSGAKDAAAGAAAANRNAPRATGAQGAAAGAALEKRKEPSTSDAAGTTAGATANNGNRYAGTRTGANAAGMYGAGWYGDHAGAWVAPGWGAGTAWVATPWATLAGTNGYGSRPPVNYDYGGTVNYQNGNVVVNGQNAGTAQEFSQQAQDLATAGSQAETADSKTWLPLGVFAMVREEREPPKLIVQLAISQQGILRGNFTDEVTNKTSPIHGAVDKQTQRAAWTVGDDKTTVMEAGISNLTEQEAPALVHKNGKTDHWILVRLEQPKE